MYTHTHTLTQPHFHHLDSPYYDSSTQAQFDSPPCPRTATGRPTEMTRALSGDCEKLLTTDEIQCRSETLSHRITASSNQLPKLNKEPKLDFV